VTLQQLTDSQYIVYPNKHIKIVMGARLFA
jgi:hypothetical protein